MHAAIVNMHRVETYMYNKRQWGYTEILPFVLSCFAYMLNYGISSVLWAPSSLKTPLYESSPTLYDQDRYADLRRTVEIAGEFLHVTSLQLYSFGVSKQ